jgi:quinol monooxygenase YgiN
MTILVRAEVRVRPGRREEFTSVARALERAAASEAGTLRYDWYRSADPRRADSEGASQPGDGRPAQPAGREGHSEERTERGGEQSSSVFVVIEEYIDPAAALAHNEHCASLLGRVAELAEITAAQLHGDLGPELEDWVARHDLATAYPPLH